MKIFNNPYNGTPQVWSAQSASLQVVGMKGNDLATVLGALEGVTVSYQRQSQTRYPIGGNKPIKMMSVPTGQISLSTIVGPTTNVTEFLQKFSSACQTFTIKVRFSSNTDTTDKKCATAAKSPELTCSGCTGTQLQYALSSQNGMSLASGTFVIDFTDLDVKQG